MLLQAVVPDAPEAILRADLQAQLVEDVEEMEVDDGLIGDGL